MMTGIAGSRSHKSTQSSAFVHITIWQCSAGAGSKTLAPDISRLDFGGLRGVAVFIFVPPVQKLDGSLRVSSHRAVYGLT